MHQWSKKAKAMITAPLMLLLLFAVACGATAQDTPVPPTATTAPAADPTPAGAAVEPTKATAAVSDMKPTAVPTAAPQALPALPEWVSTGQGKHYNGIIPWVWRNNPGFWDVHYGGSLTTSLMPSAPRFNQLVEYNPVKTDEIIGDLAESWEVSNDGTVYTFRIHDAQWTDGKPVHAEDIVFSLDRIVEPGAIRARTGSLKQFYEQGTAEVIDERTVRVPIKFPAATFLLNMASDYFKMYPKHRIEGQSQEDLNCCPENLIGSGPWIFKDWQRQEGYEYEKNPNYFKEGRPFFDGFEVFLIQDTSRAISALQVGQVMGTYGALPTYKPELVTELEKDTGGKMRVVSIPNSVIYGWYLNITEPPFDNPKVRRALYLGVDRQEGVRVATKGFGSVGTFFQPGVVEDVDDIAQVPGYRYTPEGKKDPRDLAEARQLLSEAGYADGFKGTINTSTSPTTVVNAEVLSEQLRRDFNIDLTLTTKDTATFYVELRDGTRTVSNVGTGIILFDPSDLINQNYEVDVLRNPHNWTDPELTKLIEAQGRELDPAKRQEIFEDIVDILRQGEGHVVPYLWRTATQVLDYRIRNRHAPQTVQLVNKMEHIWFDPDAKIPAGTGYIP